MKTKVCKDCRERKALSLFPIHTNRCKRCQSKVVAAILKKKYHSDPVYRARHLERTSKRNMKRYYSDALYRSHLLTQKHTRTKTRYQSDPVFRNISLMRRRLLSALEGKLKACSSLQLLGCSPAALKEHLERQFTSGMTWENQGRWHVDHIRPCVSFDLTDPDEQRKCFHFTNLQPLWAKDNMTKAARW